MTEFHENEMAVGFWYITCAVFADLKINKNESGTSKVPSVVTVKKPCVLSLGVKCGSLCWAHSGSAPFESCYSLSWQESHKKQPFRLDLMWSLLLNSAWADTGKRCWKSVAVKRCAHVVGYEYKSWLWTRDAAKASICQDAKWKAQGWASKESSWYLKQLSRKPVA